MPSRLYWWKAAGFFLAVFPAHAAPPNGCIENSAGARWCEHWEKHTLEKNQVFSDPHPATVVRPPQPYHPVGQIVASLPVSGLLPGYAPAFLPQFSPFLKPQKSLP